MAYVYFNNNPLNKATGDCVIRALSIITGMSWDETYDELSEVVHDIGELPSDNTTRGEYLKRIGYERHVIPDICPTCYTVRDFCKEYPRGVYVLATGSHVVAVVDGDYIDAWDSGNETWNSQQSLENRLDTIAQNQQNCCCENRLAMANLTSTILAENCADRQALSDGVRDILAATQAQTQTVLTQMCNDKIDEKNERIIDLQNKLNMAELRESQNLQTGILLANNASQTQQLLATGTAAGRSTTNGTSS